MLDEFGSPFRGKVTELAKDDDLPNSSTPTILPLRLGRVNADMAGRSAGRSNECRGSDSVCVMGGGISLILLAAELERVVVLSLDRSRFIDIFRKKPHFPVLVPDEAFSEGDTTVLLLEPEEPGASLLDDDPGVMNAPSDSALAVRRIGDWFRPRSKRLPADLILCIRGSAKGRGATRGADCGASSAIASSGDKCDGVVDTGGVNCPDVGAKGEVTKSLTDCAELMDEASEADETTDRMSRWLLDEVRGGI